MRSVFGQLFRKNLPQLTLIFVLQVHTFYEAVGCMINAQVDGAAQEALIEKYMSLPNQVWDDIISQASKVCEVSILGRC